MLNRLILTALPSCVFLLATPCLSSGQALHGSRADSLSLPRVQEIYEWVDPGQWELNLYSTYTYFPNGKTDTNVNYRDPAEDPMNRVIYTWDEWNRLSAITVEDFDTAWSNQNHYEYAYDEHGNDLLTLNYIWFAGDWQATTGSRYTYTYDQQAYITQEITEKYNVLQYWVFDEKTEYLFGKAGGPDEIRTYHWNLSEWVPFSRLLDIDWKSYDGEHASGEYNSYVQTSWDQQWVSDLRRYYTYGDFGSFSYIEQDFRNDTWVNDVMVEEIRNEDSLVGETKTSSWVDQSWLQAEGYRYTYVTEGIDLLEIRMEAWDPELKVYVNSEKVVYSDFIHYLGMKEESGETLDVLVWPNPARDKVRIILNEPDVYRVTVVNSSGQAVMSQRLQERQEAVLDVSMLGAGVYFLVFERKGGSPAVRKIIKP